MASKFEQIYKVQANIRLVRQAKDALDGIEPGIVIKTFVLADMKLDLIDWEDKLKKRLDELKSMELNELEQAPNSTTIRKAH